MSVVRAESESQTNNCDLLTHHLNIIRNKFRFRQPRVPILCESIVWTSCWRDNSESERRGPEHWEHREDYSITGDHCEEKTV